MKDKAEAQAAIDAERDAARIANVPWQGIQLAAQDIGNVLASRCATADGDRVVGVIRHGLLVGREFAQPVGHAGDGSRQIAHAAAGDVLLVEVVLLEQGEPLQFGVGLGERQHGRVARCDRLDLGVGEFLAADVLGPAGGVVAGDDLAR